LHFERDFFRALIGVPTPIQPGVFSPSID